VADDAPSPPAFYRPLLSGGLVWVAQDGGELIGFAACEPFDDALHLWQIAVRHDRQARGAGRALLAAVVEAARSGGAAAVTLTTFRDIPWNGPFYASMAFAELTSDQLNARLQAVRLREAALGLDVAARCAMRLAL
jgi:GNAT superfamily N-acetyltransferase